MKQLAGWELVELTETKIVQRQWQGTGWTYIIGNPNPDPEEHRKGIEDLTTFLIDCIEKNKAREELERERNNEINITDREGVLQDR